MSDEWRREATFYEGCVADAVASLDALDASDPEAAHGKADEVLLRWVPREIREAYNRLADRCEWWA